ncbi:hypothetical protein [Bacillus cereus group sp. N21]|uniref:hypothetical protein n=1 Tax=Bacillus cereus group sp. N21 TaxID=2794591 RepID=UPI0018F3A1BE|nr:hypothetical protein [Bacillus cereus group sp. N21]MBJ8030407.1 hypothetical protein [Bacillus cereus group sp. N21]
MPHKKLTIVPVTLHSENKKTFVTHSPAGPSSYPACTIKTVNTEISFFNSTDEPIIQTVMKELKLL